MVESQRIVTTPDIYEGLIDRLGRALDAARTAGRLRDERPVELELRGLSRAELELIKAYLEDLLQTLFELGVSHLYVADGNYFKVLAKQSKAEPHLGYVLPCQYKAFHAPEAFKVCLGLNHQALIYNPDLQAKLDLSLDALASDLGGSYQALGADIIHSCWYPEDLRSIAHALDSLHQYPSLTCDIETLPIGANVWGLFDQNVGLNQINEDWAMLSFAAKYYDKREVHYADTRNAVGGIRDDKDIVAQLVALLQSWSQFFSRFAARQSLPIRFGGLCCCFSLLQSRVRRGDLLL